MSFSLELQLRARYGSFELNLEWRTTRRFLGLFGSSGAGKTSVLQAIAGLRPEIEGVLRVGERVWLDSARGVHLPAERRGVGFVPQEGLLFPHLDVLGNVQAGAARAQASPRRLDPEQVLEVLELQALRSRRVTSLSGGERQRVALARALCSGPELLLLDEPLASLDLPLRRRILPYLLRVREAFGIPTLHVAHDATETLVLCDEVLVLDGGRSIAAGPAREVLADPSGPALARTEGMQNVWRGRVALDGSAAARVAVADGFELVVPAQSLAHGREAIFAVRAEEIVLAAGDLQSVSAQNRIRGTVRDVRRIDGGLDGAEEVFVVVETASSQRLIAAVTAAAASRLGLVPGLAVLCVFKAHSCRLVALI